MKITIENLTKKFGDFTAVNNFNATIESGELIALLGPSGCGKSTMLNMLSGILPVTEGRIYFDNDDVTDIGAEKRGVGLVFQNYALYPHMTVLENIAFPLEIKKVKKAEREAKAIYQEAAERMNRKIQPVCEIIHIQNRTYNNGQNGKNHQKYFKNRRYLQIQPPLQKLRRHNKNCICQTHQRIQPLTGNQRMQKHRKAEQLQQPHDNINNRGRMIFSLEHQCAHSPQFCFLCIH